MVRKEKSILVVGDRVLVRPDTNASRSAHGLYLPPSVNDRDAVRTGTVMMVGPGYAIPNPEYSESEPWAPRRDPARYIPLQAREGDHVLFLRKEAIEIEYDGERLLVVPQPALLLLVREEFVEGEIGGAGENEAE